jgi:hypothetical protein
MEWLHSERAHRLIAAMALGAWGGFYSAIESDIDRFRGWQSWGDVRAYNWKLATFRWCKGAVMGLAGGLTGGLAIGL